MPLSFSLRELLEGKRNEKARGENGKVKKDEREKAFIIACDSGYENARKMGVRPDLIVGDFDSAPRPDTDVPIFEYPTRKDDTDTMLAVRHALDGGYTDIVIICALGGRLDHMYANLQTAAFVVEKGGICRIIGENEEITVFCGKMRFPRKKGYSLSVFSMTDRAEGVTVRGTKYEVSDVVINNTYPIGTSNVWMEEEAEVSVRKGMLTVIESKLREGEHI